MSTAALLNRLKPNMPDWRVDKDMGKEPEADCSAGSQPRRLTYMQPSADKDKARFATAWDERGYAQVAGGAAFYALTIYFIKQ